MHQRSDVTVLINITSGILLETIGHGQKFSLGQSASRNYTPSQTKYVQMDKNSQGFVCRNLSPNSVHMTYEKAEKTQPISPLSMNLGGINQKQRSH